MEENSVDSLVTDPPAGISFMGKEWDTFASVTGSARAREPFIEFMKQVFKECFRVLKPGAHGLVWAIPRTSHWTATACEDAGFEVRDVITHLFGSGFPKSLDISKAIDKAAGAEREVVGKTHCGLHHRGGVNSFTDDNWKAENRDGDFVKVTAPATPEAKRYQGYGTALKPASEHWILIRKPLSEKTVAANVLKWGTGGMNIDASRIARTIPQCTGQGFKTGKFSGQIGIGDTTMDGQSWNNTQGRFPANLILSHNPDCVEVGVKKVKLNGSGASSGNTTKDKSIECSPGCAVAELDRQSGTLKNGGQNYKGGDRTSMFGNMKVTHPTTFAGDSGGASRFFYCAKASKSERNAGLDKPSSHPTVKPLKLMRYLVRLVTPKGGVVLDPFLGSGSTGVAALAEGFQFIGIEKEKEYIEIAEKRLEHVTAQMEIGI